MDDPNMPAYGEDGPDDAEIGRQWRENSSLEKWFPLTAEELARLRKEADELRAALKLAMWAMRAPLDDWKGECERKALDAARAALGPNV